MASSKDKRICSGAILLFFMQTLQFCLLLWEPTVEIRANGRILGMYTDLPMIKVSFKLSLTGQTRFPETQDQERGRNEHLLDFIGRRKYNHPYTWFAPDDNSVWDSIFSDTGIVVVINIV